ncbi:hypothetical protein LRC39_03965 [Rhodopseudomonas sp. P1]|uniref:hypothetical protein n=1 Tax=Rhodopseudomonas sp. P1 TaxID=3434357 RepID=UPI0031FDC669
MTTKPVIAKSENIAAKAASPEAGALSNFERLSSHLPTESLAAKLLDAYRTAKPGEGKAQMIKITEAHFSAGKDHDASKGSKN